MTYTPILTADLDRLIRERGTTAALASVGLRTAPRTSVGWGRSVRDADGREVFCGTAEQVNAWLRGGCKDAA